MTKLTIEQTKQLSGGKMSGVFLTGIVAIINACSNSLTNLISTGFSTYFAAQQMNRTEGGYKTTNGAHLTWSDKYSNLNYANYSQILFV
ncbi:MAG: bacteriocin leader domain-containing protein [Spiroplasma poulsonii]|uniref:Uncharacterized protein n=1 Tax=Spiroplasma poulsonii TaxID=2138 RepID=A0A2P6FD64_9MOLU|nr:MULTISPECIES: hypothetical protein [Spiroplasma]KAF0851034.1 putative transmembrane protein [Spiroplasma poulsonii]MBH8623100.1 bacteriocin leader domain-containing protein [Spiroplasma sp. hyd1]MBW1241951.1 bacteriocin leader domain-containing protein [Spiroplasma poulsonii]PQM31405.1 hypothetical protein SMSRO_SF012360 [Spiroplasma poulsonii]PWF96419.1 hypothetical protein SMSE_18660 [Spiroplasma poulsonii]